MLDEKTFLRTISGSESPAEYECNWLVFADWLEEQGDPRGEDIRVFFLGLNSKLKEFQLDEHSVYRVLSQIRYYFSTRKLKGWDFELLSGKRGPVTSLVVTPYGGRTLYGIGLHNSTGSMSGSDISVHLRGLTSRTNSVDGYRLLRIWEEKGNPLILPYFD